jgi:hypothetical protein
VLADSAEVGIGGPVLAQVRPDSQEALRLQWAQSSDDSQQRGALGSRQSASICQAHRPSAIVHRTSRPQQPDEATPCKVLQSPLNTAKLADYMPGALRYTRDPSLRTQLAKELTRLRTRGLNDPRLNDLEALLKVADALGDGDSELARVEDAIEKVLSNYNPDSVHRQVLRLWLGLDDKTRSEPVTARHEAAWKCYGEARVELATFTSHGWAEYRDTLARWLADAYAEHLVTPASRRVAPAGPRPAGPATHDGHQRRDSRHGEGHLAWLKPPWRVALAGVLVVGLGVAITWLASPTNSRKPQPTKARTLLAQHAYSLTAPADIPEMNRGTGTDTMHGKGYYGRRSFTARGGVVLFRPDQDAFEIILYPEPVPCSLWYRGTPAGLEFTIDVYANAKRLAAIPIGRPLNEYYVNWVTTRGNSSQLDTAAASRNFDGLGEPGQVILTAIETTPGGFWRGKVVTHPSKTAAGVRQAFTGTFAAQWCNMSPGPT